VRGGVGVGSQCKRGEGRNFTMYLSVVDWAHGERSSYGPRE
jgi:hypothetical protein